MLDANGFEIEVGDAVSAQTDGRMVEGNVVGLVESTNSVHIEDHEYKDVTIFDSADVFKIAPEVGD